MDCLGGCSVYNTPMADVYLGLGSNLGDRMAYLRRALDAIEQLPDAVVVEQSPVYETPPMGPQDQGAYCNMAVYLKTSLSPRTLITHLQSIETQLGRPSPEHRQHWGPREIDIDVLLYDEQVINEPGLTVPHPGIPDRWFVLKPLTDLAAGSIHPVLNCSIKTLLTEVEKATAQGVSHE